MFIETKDMLRPKIYVINKRKVYDVDYINFDDKSYGVTEEDGLCEEYTFNEVALMENTGIKDKNGKYIYLGDIVKIVETFFEVKYKIFKGYAIENEDYTLSLEANFDTATVIGNIYENKELLEDI